jgi:hypothetical protein
LCPSEPVKVGAFFEALEEVGFGEALEGGRVQVRGAGEGMQDGEGRGGTGVHDHLVMMRRRARVACASRTLCVSVGCGVSLVSELRCAGCQIRV